jgi:translation initiation factor IF-3
MEDGTQLGVLPTHEALRQAEEKGLDLVEVSPKAMPPVCRIMDYGKFKFENSKKASHAKKHASVIEVKEIKFRPKTDDHDFDFKVRHIRRFLEEGNKCRLVIAFRGREIVHPETGKAMLDHVIRALVDIAHVEQMPLMDGRKMNMVISPKPQRAGHTMPPPAHTGSSSHPPRPGNPGPVIMHTRPSGQSPAPGPGTSASSPAKPVQQAPAAPSPAPAPRPPEGGK